MRSKLKIEIRRDAFMGEQKVIASINGGMDFAIGCTPEINALMEALEHRAIDLQAHIEFRQPTPGFWEVEENKKGE